MVDSVVNFRDFGGLSSRFGGRIKPDRLYRSGALATVADADIERLLGFDFALIADLRYAGEREHEPSPWPVAYADRVVSHDGGLGVEAPHMAPLRDGTMDEEKADRIYVELYREMPFDPLYQPLFARVLNALPDLDGRALIHCSAGKDRTGVLAALIQHALGVPRDEIYADYMKSRHSPGLLAMVRPTAQRMTERFGVPIREALMRRLFDVDETWLDAFLGEIERQSGSIDAYLDAIGLDAKRRERLREKLLTG
jgi:protein-tyrosine phosphatase